MNFEFAPDVEDFRAEVRAFLKDEMAVARTRGHRDDRDLTGWDEAFERAHVKRAGQRGYLGISAPAEMGGGGKPLAYQAVFGFEAAYFDAPCVDTAMTLAGAPLIAFGSETQRSSLLPKMLSGEVGFCLGYTEANAGSDLTRVEATARTVGDGFAIDGVKTLVTGAHKADIALIIARTDSNAKPRAGMSLFLVDMQTPGISVERRETMNRWTLSDVCFEDVRVDSSSLLGELNRGWHHMASALASERSQLFHVGWATRDLDELVAFCRETSRGSAPLAADPAVRRTLARLRVELGTATRLAKRVVWMQDAGHVVGHEAAIAKLYATELLQRVAHTATTLLGPYGALVRDSHLAPLAGRMAYEYVERVHPTISVGSNEIQRNAIATQGLGMPRQA